MLLPASQVEHHALPPWRERIEPTQICPILLLDYQTQLVPTPLFSFVAVKYYQHVHFTTSADPPHQQAEWQGDQLMVTLCPICGVASISRH